MINKSITKYLFLLISIFTFFGVATANAQILHEDYQGTWHGKVINILDEELRTIQGTDTEHLYQTIEVEVLNGPQKGETIIIENDYLELDKNDKFYFNYNVYLDGTETYGVVSIDRKDSIFFLIGAFVLAVIILGKWQGVRAILALIGSFLAIFYILIPSILNGLNPILTSVLVASGILFVAIFFTHGFNKESFVAYVGTMVAVFLTGLFATFSVKITDLSGFASDASTYLNFNTGGTIDFTALLLGAIILGVLGVLDDISVTQAAVVTEIYTSNPSLKPKEVYKKAMRVGREHVGALVNTLVLAYTSVSLPLLLHASMVSSSVGMAINSEIFATEIVRAIVGSIGLILAVPIVTIFAVFYLKNYKPKHSHSHSHGHSHHK